MSRKKKSSLFFFDEEQNKPSLKPETKKGVILILLCLISLILFLSLFHLAGNIGIYIEQILQKLFGIDRYLLPLLLLTTCATLIYPHRGTFKSFHYIGFFCFFVSFNGLLNLLLIHTTKPITQDITLSGGYVGEIFGLFIPKLFGYWGSFTLSFGILIISILLIFNTSIQNVFSFHKKWFKNKIQTLDDSSKNTVKKELDDEDEEIVDESIVTEDDFVEDENETPEKIVPFFRKKQISQQPVKEMVLTTKKQRKITIPLELLEHSTSKAQAGDIELNATIIEQTFKEFGIDVEMGETSIGPTVTQFTLRPSQGVKLSRILGLQNDLALALAAHPLRIEAPIPGKSLVGIEVPNTKVATVTLRDVMENKTFTKEATGLSIPLGKDVSGNPWIIDLAKMPHLLVAGSTGSGKSVCLNTLIVSLLYQNGPDDLKLIMVDPKRVELTIFSGIPHLLVPPIINADDTINALKWTVREMERRLDVLSKFGSRNITEYNNRCEEKMPKIVVIIDELADLMTTSGREVESTIVRIAQMARAVGIHLVLATQRPSVDVITGLIKANIPGRIAFAVASQTDSRTILDISGAEKLLGRGDMLFTFAELAKPKRIQGAYASTEEIERVVQFLKQNGEPDYNMAITEITKSGTVFNSSNEDDSDPLLKEAAQIVIQAGKASTSFLQRRLRVGYARAARLIDLLEEAGVVGAGDGAKPREILLDNWPNQKNEQKIPTAQDDFDEAQQKTKEENREFEKEIPLPNLPQSSSWENEIDEGWLIEENQKEQDKDV